MILLGLSVQKVDYKYFCIRASVPEVYLEKAREKYGRNFLQILQERICLTIHSGRSPDSITHDTPDKTPWPNAGWHFRVLMRKIKSNGTTNDPALLEQNFNYSPWRTVQFKNGSNFRLKNGVGFHLLPEMRESITLCSKIWGITLPELIQEALEDITLSPKVCRGKFNWWKSSWKKLCSHIDSYNPVWYPTFTAIRDLGYDKVTGENSFRMPNISAIYYRRNFQ